MFENAEKFYIEFAENTEVWLIRLMFMLEVNKMEALYQKENAPPVFIKTVNEFGLVYKVQLTELYKGKVPKLKTTFSESEKSAVWDVILSDNGATCLAVMLIASSGETRLAHLLDSEKVKSFPILLKTYDSLGFVKAYRYHPKFVDDIIPMLRKSGVLDGKYFQK